MLTSKLVCFSSNEIEEGPAATSLGSEAEGFDCSTHYNHDNWPHWNQRSGSGSDGPFIIRCSCSESPSHATTTFEHKDQLRNSETPWHLSWSLAQVTRRSQSTIPWLVAWLSGRSVSISGSTLREKISLFLFCFISCHHSLEIIIYFLYSHSINYYSFFLTSAHDSPGHLYIMCVCM